MLTLVINPYALILLFMLLRLTLRSKPKYKLINEIGVPEELLKYVHSAANLWGLKGTVTIIEYKRKREK